jgi:vacuolar-type H+-ATPase subunit H
MKQVIEEVLQAEERVGALLKGAREQADEIRRSAEQENSTLLNNARTEAQALTQSSLEEAKKEAEQIKADRLEQADQAKDTLLNDNADKVDGLVKDLCGLIMTSAQG